MRRRRRRQQRRFPVYAMPAVIVAMGMSALILAIAWPSSTQSSALAPIAALAEGEEPDLTSHDNPEPARAKRASEPETAEGPAVELAARAPVMVRQPAPSEALPAVQARGLGISTGRGASGGLASDSKAAPSVATGSTSGAYSVAVVPEGPSRVDEAASELVSRLKRGGIDARLTYLEDVGRPDALIVLGESGSAGNETWYCDPGPAASVQLARSVMQAGGSAGGGAEGPQGAFPCEEVHSGRARVPAVLLELSPQALGQREQIGAAMDGLSKGLSRYFSENASAVRQARGAAKLTWPAAGPITSYYGPSHPLGIDVGQWQGSILAATPGMVVWAGGDPCCGYGRYVVIKSSDGIETLYAHLETLAVRKGQKVRQGQSLGRVGCTGHCSGPHLHFEVYDNGRRQDPMRYLP